MRNIGFRRVFAIVRVAVAAVPLAGLSHAPAQTGIRFVVDSHVDLPDEKPGDGPCRSSDGSCTLRAAVMEANAFVAPNAQDPLIDIPAGDYRLSSPLELARNVTIVGAGIGRTNVLPGTNAGLRVMAAVRASIARLTVRGGHAEPVAGIDGLIGGGAIRNEGVLNLTDCSFENNSAIGRPFYDIGFGPAYGGAILSTGRRLSDVGSARREEGLWESGAISARSRPNRTAT